MYRTRPRLLNDITCTQTFILVFTEYHKCTYKGLRTSTSVHRDLHFEFTLGEFHVLWLLFDK